MAKIFEYKQLFLPDHPNASVNGCIYEHVIVAEKLLGRKLKQKEVVHHIDGNKKNNAPENIMVFATNADHIRFHRGGTPFREGDVWKSTSKEKESAICKFCGKVFYPVQASKHTKYCSPKCKAEDKRKYKLTIEEIKEKLFEYKGNFSALARELNVSSSGIAKYLKMHNQPHTAKDYKFN